MPLPTPVTAKNIPRKILVKEITGPIRAILGEKITFEILQCSIDGRPAPASELRADELGQIKWVIKQAVNQTYYPQVGGIGVSSTRLVVSPGIELAKGTGNSIEYIVTTGMVGTAIVAMAYINKPSPAIAQWVKISTSANFQPSSTDHLALQTYPEVTDTFQLDGDFMKKWDAFAIALVAAGADVNITSTMRSMGRAYMMHYCSLVAHGAIQPWEVPDTINNHVGDAGHVGVEWSHTLANGRVDVAASKKAAKAMMFLFEIAYPAALTSNHTRGKAIDVTIEWSGTLKIREKPGVNKDGAAAEGKEIEITTTPRHGGTQAEPAGNKALREVAETYGVKKLITDAPHWSVDGK